MDWKAVISKLAPTVATALGGPLAGTAVAAIGSILGLNDATADKIEQAIVSGSMTPEQVSEIRKLELQYQADEKERGFRYAELAYKDRDSARKANVEGGTQTMLFWLSLILLVMSLGTEIYVLFEGYPAEIPEIIVGRVLGLLDAVAMLVLTYWYGTTAQSDRKTSLIAQSPAIK